MKIVNLPPQLRGTPEEQIALLRNYLVQLAQELTRVSNEIEELSNKENEYGNQKGN